MKNPIATFLTPLIILLLTSCAKESASPSAAQANTTLLAGPAGSSKNWSLLSITDSGGGATYTWSATSTTPVPACELDNIFQFSNNSLQSYTQSEGATSCQSSDPATVESGSWAFTNDGKTLLVEAFVNVSDSQTASPAEPFLLYMILAEAGPLSVSKITSTSLSLSYGYTDTSVNPSTSHTVTLALVSR
ncbi:MAG: hypothetical protein JSS93_07855 [Bacteroidetes bacterium]|nr:hypothetical protein [Bacteroidota bacterium]